MSGNPGGGATHGGPPPAHGGVGGPASGASMATAPLWDNGLKCCLTVVLNLKNSHMCFVSLGNDGEILPVLCSLRFSGQC